MFKWLRNLPIPIAATAMALLMLTGVALGNNNALKEASVEANAQRVILADYVDTRVTQMNNLLTLLNRYTPESEAAEFVEDLIAERREADTPAALYQYNERLSFAAESAAEALQSTVTDANMKTLLTSVLDEMESAQSKLRRSAGVYNSAVADAEAVYGKLPFRFLIGDAPEAYR